MVSNDQRIYQTPHDIVARACADIQMFVFGNSNFELDNLDATPDPLKDHGKQIIVHCIDAQETRAMVSQQCGHSSRF